MTSTECTWSDGPRFGWCLRRTERSRSSTRAGGRKEGIGRSMVRAAELQWEMGEEALREWWTILGVKDALVNHGIALEVDGVLPLRKRRKQRLVHSWICLGRCSGELLEDYIYIYIVIIVNNKH